MQTIIPENINLHPNEDGIRFCPIVNNQMPFGYVIQWEEIDYFIERLKMLQQGKEDVEAGRSPF